MIAALLLAAGRSRRFGADKLVAPLGAWPVIRWSVEALGAVCDRVYVVVPPDAHAVRDALASLDVVLVAHAGRDAGMGSSIGAGIRALPADARAAMIALADQPLVSREVATAVRDAWRERGAPAVVPRYRDGRGHPVLFGRGAFAALAALDGDRGARGVLGALGARVEEVPVDADMPLDVDTRAALLAVERMLSG